MDEWIGFLFFTFFSSNTLAFRKWRMDGWMDTNGTGYYLFFEVDQDRIGPFFLWNSIFGLSGICQGLGFRIGFFAAGWKSGMGRQGLLFYSSRMDGRMNGWMDESWAGKGVRSVFSSSLHLLGWGWAMEAFGDWSGYTRNVQFFFVRVDIVAQAIIYQFRWE